MIWYCSILEHNEPITVGACSYIKVRKVWAMPDADKNSGKRV